MRMMIDGTEVSAVWEENESVKALEEMCRKQELTVQMSRYGGFEQVGSIGKSLLRKDVQTKTSPGDIVLYSGSQMVMFYGSNSWAYTRLGRITGCTEKEIRKLLGTKDVTVTLDAR
nr:cyclophilin-like fold protein [uncultured Anaerostipes sp.]